MSSDEPRSPSNVEEPLAMSWSIGRMLAVIVAVATVLFWAWILSGAPRKENPDRLADREYVSWARQRCATLTAKLDSLPNALSAANPAERADDLDVANSLLEAMVDDLEDRAPTEGDDGDVMRAWIADWRVYVADREDYADRLRVDANAVLHVTENADLHDGVDNTIEIFAGVNDMPECTVPGDVG